MIGTPFAWPPPSTTSRIRVEEQSLVPAGDARLGRIGLDEWLRRSQADA